MEQVLNFLKQLSKNNNKEWFDGNRKKYEVAKANFIEVVAKVIDNSTVFDSALLGLEPKKCLFRINKDIRFSKDKSPYKLNMGASINPGGKKEVGAGYYIHIEPGKSFLAGGFYMPPAEILSAIRQEIDYNGEELTRILNEKSFKLYFKNLSDEGDKLKTAPKGYSKDHPNLSLLQHKHFIAVHQLTDEQVKDKKFINHTTQVFKAILPLNQFLRRCI